MKKLFTLITLLAMAVSGAWAAEEVVYKTVWSEDFESASQNNYGFTAANATAFAGQQELQNGTHAFHIFGGTVNGRTYNLSFSGNDIFSKYSDFIFEFDYAVSSGNTDAASLTINGNAGTLFSITTASSATTAVVKNSASESLGSITATKYANPGTTGQNNLPTNFYHFTVVSNENGVKLTVTGAGNTVVVNNAVLSNEFTKITSMSIATGRYYTHQLIDDITLSIPQKTIVTTTTTWNLKSISATTIWIALDGSETFNINGTTMQKSTSNAVNGLLFDNGTNVWRVGNFGLRQQSSNGTKNIGIPSLKAGDVVTVIGSWSGSEASIVTSVSGNASLVTSVDNKTSTITMNSDGDLSIGLRRNASGNYYSAESIQLVHKEVSYTFDAGDDATMAITNAAPETAGNADGWTLEGNGNRPFVYGQLFENWNDNHAAATFNYYQTINGLPNGYYVVGADVFSDQGEINGAVGLYASSNGNEVHAPVTLLATKETVATPEILVENGTLTIGVKNWATIAASWFYANNFTLTYVGETPTTVPVTIGQYGYATYVTPYAMDFTDTDITAYEVKADIEHSVVHMTSVNQVPANTAVVLKGTSDNIPVIASADPIDSDLTYSATATAYDAQNTYYYLGQIDGKVGFRPLAKDGSIAAGKCYISIPVAPQSKPLSISLDGENATDAGVVEAAPAVVKNGKFATANGIVVVKNGVASTLGGILK